MLHRLRVALAIGPENMLCVGGNIRNDISVSVIDDIIFYQGDSDDLIWIDDE